MERIEVVAGTGGDDEHLKAMVQWSLTPGVGPRTCRALIDYFGTAEEAARASPEQLRKVVGVGPKMVSAIIATRQPGVVEEEIENCRRHDVQMLPWDDPRYPAAVREISTPPIVLFVRGELLASDALAIGIVGTRHPTSYGTRQAENLAGGLSRAGLVIVSGLARGIDGAAHRAALLAGGRTIAVLGCGVLQVYPPEHAELANQIRERGVLVSEAPPRSQPHSGTFPQRNRLISGFSLGVVVVEAGLRSGAHISAEHALEQGREVFAVPGPVDSRVSRGCHRLIREGAKLVETPDDVLEELGPLFASAEVNGREVRRPAELQLNEQEQAVLAATASEPRLVDAIVAQSGLPVQRVLATLSVLEMRHLVRRVSGGAILRV